MNLIQMLLLFLMFIVINSLDSRSMFLRQNWSMVITSCGIHSPTFLNKQFNVSVPSTLHLNLEKHKQIPNPYFGSQLKQLTYLSDCSVKFRKSFQLSEEFIRQYSKTVLRFEGIDTYSNVTLNGIRIGNTQNAFLQYQFDVKPHVKMGNNQLEVEIKSSKPLDAERQKNDRMPFEYAHTRKACYQYSWDWAPYMNTVGIWLPVSLVFYNLAKFEYVWIRNKELTERKAILDFTLALDGIDQKNSNTNHLEVRLLSKNTKEDLRFKLVSRYNSFELTITSPQLWWPNNIGDPYLYQFELSLMQKDSVLDHKKIMYGIRTVKLNSEGTNFQIIVNGYPIYCKGANYVPPDMMYPRLINQDFTPANTIQNLLNDAVQSNFNMIRVWGGGQYQTDQFYEMASKKGIMIFHDFMFSDSVYPGTDQFLVNVKKEVVYQVRRLRNYPAIVLWSGNNQILQGIQSWGWGQPRYRENYRKLFGQLIPDILNIECNYLPYIQSSPSKGVGNSGFGQGGDIHYWGVWAASAPFENYESALGGFNSEFGTQSLPVWQTISQFTTTNDRMYESEQMAFHEKHVSRFNTLKSYIIRYSKPSKSFELQAFLSGLVQAYGLEIAIRAQRCSKPKSFGTLYWQFNDAWPSISWSSIDYYGRWKPLQYLAKQYFKDIILFFHPNSGKFVAINDKLVEIKAKYNIEVIRFDGLVVYQDSGLLSLKPNEKREIRALDTAYFAGKENNTVVYTEIIYGEHQDNKTALTTYFRPFKDLQLEPATLNVKYLYESNQIQFTSMELVKNLYVSSTQYYLKLSENYFDVLPGRPKKIEIIKPTSLQDLQSSLKFRSYRQIIDDTQGLGIRLEN